METVNNLASAASRAIWGEGQDPNHSNTTTTTTTSAREPISGELGDVKHGEPYDKGNVENSSLTGTPTTGTTSTGTPTTGITSTGTPTTGTTSTGTTSTGTTSTGTTSTGTTTGVSSTTAGPHDTSAANKVDPRVDSDLDGSKKLGTTGSNPALTNTNSTLDSKISNTHTSEIPGNTPATQPIRSEHDTDKTGVTSLHQPTSATSSTKPTSSNDTTGAGPTPSVSADPTTDTSASHPSDIEQGSTNPKDTPSATQKNAIKDTKSDLETSATGSSEPHKSNEKSTYTEKGGTPGGMPDTIKQSLEDHSHGEGTGEQYVKSTGMGAEGGDFDASNPGAGREADRLLGEKGIHHEPAAKKSTEDSHTSKDSSSGDKEKVSLSEKIKDKLHIHKH